MFTDFSPTPGSGPWVGIHGPLPGICERLHVEFVISMGYIPIEILRSWKVPFLNIDRQV